MDYISIPSFALLRYGTVITRLKMDRRGGCSQSEARREEVARVVHRVSRCEQCTRTRIVSQCSDCDSALVGKCRSYRTRAAKSRYVNVCAAVCLLLLVGGLTPQSSAAPHRTRTMDRSKRASEQENETWSNPCDFDKSILRNPPEYTPKLAEIVANQARSAHEIAKMFKNEIAGMHSFKDFEDMLNVWKHQEWLRNRHWFRDEILPKDKQFGNTLEESNINQLMTPSKIDELLPVFSKAMKLLAAGLQEVKTSLKPASPISNTLTVQSNLQNTSENVRHILCLTSDIIRARRLEMLPLFDSEIPKYTSNSDTLQDMFLIYRDTVNFLEYVDQFFDSMYKTQV